MKHTIKFLLALTLFAMTPYLAGCSRPLTVTAASSTKSETAQIPTDAFSYKDYADLLAKYVTDKGEVDYKALLANREPLDKFTAAMAAISEETYNAWDNNAKLALWVNAYNAYTLTAIIDHYPIQLGGIIARVRFPQNSIRQIPGVWNKLEWGVVGKKYTLEGIENDILRIEFADEPRVHMAIVCASVGCPPLRNEPFRAEKLDTQLADQSRQFLATTEKLNIDRDAKAVRLSPIFDWFGEDFVGKYGTDAFASHSEDMRAVLNFVSQYVSEADATYLKLQQYTTDFQSYDWALNEQS